MAFASISTDLYLPAMPMMAVALRTSTGMMEWTVTGYLVGFSLGQLLWGPIGDRYGRRIPVALGIVLFIIGSTGCAFAQSGTQLISWRVLQALGACAGVVLGRAMVRDLYAGERGAQMMSTLLAVMGLAPLAAPTLGGQILLLAGWRAIFLTLSGVGLLTLMALFTLPETLPKARRNVQPLLQAVGHYGQLIRECKLLGYAGTGGFYYAGMYASIAGSPFAYINYHHVPAQYFGLIFGTGVIGVMITNTLNARLIGRWASVDLLRLGVKVGAGAGLVIGVDAYTGFGGIAGLAVPVFVYVAALGFIVANSIAGAMADYPERAGAVSALVGALQYGSGIVGSALVGIFADGTPWPMGMMMAIGGIGSLVCARLISA